MGTFGGTTGFLNKDKIIKRTHSILVILKIEVELSVFLFFLVCDCVFSEVYFTISKMLTSHCVAERYSLLVSTHVWPRCPTVAGDRSPGTPPGSPR